MLFFDQASLLYSMGVNKRVNKGVNKRVNMGGRKGGETKILSLERIG
jgi:hypothetical protein